MNTWAVNGIELPFGDRSQSWWIDAVGAMDDRPVPDAESLPGRYVLSGLVDAHAHPAIGHGPNGPIVLDHQAARANLVAWAHAGISLVRDVGSPRGLTLEIPPEAGLPEVHAAGRFLAPAGRYFPQLLDSPVSEDRLVTAALAEIDRGASWVKVIADFPDLTAGTDSQATYLVESIAALTAAAHTAGARVAVHSTLGNAGQLVRAGVDSIEHGPGLDLAALEEMAHRRTAWTPTVCALTALLDAPDLPPARRRNVLDGRDRLIELLPRAVRLGVPVLAGTDVAGSIPQEVALLAKMGLDPKDALAAASVWPRQFIGATTTAANIVTYHHDPREDPHQLEQPAAVVIRGTRLR